jgi:chaperonin GroEL
VVAGKILDKSDYAFGYNPQTDECGDLIKQDIIDPAKSCARHCRMRPPVAGSPRYQCGHVAEKPMPKAPATPHGGGGMATWTSNQSLLRLA